MEILTALGVVIVIVVVVLLVRRALKSIRPEVPSIQPSGQSDVPFSVPPAVPGGALPPDVIAQIDHLVAADQRIHAIKLFRAATGVGLKEAKNRIDVWVPRGDAG